MTNHEEVKTTEAIRIDSSVMKEFHYMVELFAQESSDDHMYVDNVQDLIDYILKSIADGSRCPDSWERQVIEKMGLVADVDKHQIYRSTYGKDSD